jgi:tRNA(Ile)-lysidine synthetase-like protein
MVLLDVLYRLKDDLGLSIVVAHVNHQKRKISDVEEEFIIDFCEKQNLKIYTTRLEFETDSNFQSEARDKRFRFFVEVAEKEDIKKIVLAHHADDNMETILMRIIRGSNFAGYAGIKMISDYQGLVVYRPMLVVNKKEIIAYAKEKKLRYFEDESNFTGAYKRNRIRQNIIPFVYFEEENANEKFAYFSNTLHEASKIIEEKIKKFIREHVEITSKTISFDQTIFEKQSEFIQREIIFGLLKRENLSLSTVNEIIKQIHSNKANIVNYVFEGLSLIKEYSKISFMFEKISSTRVNKQITAIGSYDLGNGLTVNVFKKKHETNEKSENIWYNIEVLPVIIRNRLPGDRIRLTGGEKKVSDLLIDLKVPKTKRDDLLIMTNHNQEVLAIIGVKTSELLKNINNPKYQIEIKENGND